MMVTVGKAIDKVVSQPPQSRHVLPQPVLPGPILSRQTAGRHATVLCGVTG